MGSNLSGTNKRWEFINPTWAHSHVNKSDWA
uniref:Uncharacterized protein n=1 Tax=Arundo donax TaxID=35708 RepID=A0A0A8YZ86_ARUDO